ncbi:MAG TPA: LytS/YhcK type 5TM receptor domain-containing protein, partial [Gammaproteobacteria bacterium]|nr:LytS/YhcK type 5TM receptor domain-containing protein [Gammaproteobacteria bacterium]
MNELLLPLVLNAGLLLATSQILNLVIRPRLANAHRLRQVAAGVLIGLAGVGVMMFAIEWRPGLVFDLRSVLLAASGLFFGAVPTVVAMLLTASYRVLVGGAGVLMGVAVIFSSGLLGLAWRKWQQTRLESISWRSLLLLGLAVHLLMLILVPITQPPAMARDMLAAIGVPVLTLYPLATVALGLLLSARLARAADARSLQESEARYRSLFDDNHAVMLIIDPERGGIVDANPAAERYYGWSRAQLGAMRISDINTMPLSEI